MGFNNSNSSQDRLWTDNVASIIGTNSVTINTENNTNLIGGVIANITNYTSSSSLTAGRGSQEFSDGNNLTINTKTLTYSNLQDHNNSETNAIGINVGLPVGFGGSSPTNLSLVADIKNTTLGLSYAANSSAQTGETKATIGSGTINLNGTITRDATTGEVTNITNQETITANDSRISNLNRDINNNQVDKGTHYEGGYNIDLNISVAVLNRAYELHKDGLLADEAKKNLTGTGKKLYELTPMGVNKDIEATRGSEQTWLWGSSAVYKSGNEWNGVLDPKANNIGLANVPTRDGRLDVDKVGQPVPFTISNFFSGHEGGIISLGCNYIVPGCNDMSLTHDNWGGSKIVKDIPFGLQLSIIPAYPYNIMG